MAGLHRAALPGRPKSVSDWISRSDKNALAQKALHLAVSNPQHQDSLIRSGHDLDAADNYGCGPLTYAAAAN